MTYVSFNYWYLDFVAAFNVGHIIKVFKPVLFLFSFVSDHDNEYMTKKNQTGLKNFKPRKNFNHNIYNNGNGCRQ